MALLFAAVAAISQAFNRFARCFLPDREAGLVATQCAGRRWAFAMPMRERKAELTES